jgi:hypothetical protein
MHCQGVGHADTRGALTDTAALIGLRFKFTATLIESCTAHHLSESWDYSLLSFAADVFRHVFSDIQTPWRALRRDDTKRLLSCARSQLHFSTPRLTPVRPAAQKYEGCLRRGKLTDSTIMHVE